MEELIVNCQTGEQMRCRFSELQEATRLAEIAKATLEEKARLLADARQHLVIASTELQAAQALGQTGDLKPEYVAEKQASVAEAKQRLRNLETTEELLGE